MKVGATMVVASGNANKIRELQTVATTFGLQLLAPSEARTLKGLGEPPQVEETADTYLGNARLKAVAYAQWCGMPTIGDDSGLEVSALDDRPGIFSARYGGDGLSDRDRYLALLAELDACLAETGSSDRRARFRCSLVLVHPDGSTIDAEGVLEGHILSEPQGENGFGYDPIVLIDELGKTLAEVEFSTVCDMGFRAIAARKLFSKLTIG